MSKTEFGVNHPLSNKIYSKTLAKEVIRKTFIGDFVGSGKGALIQELEDLKKNAGDQITFGLRVQLQGTGVAGDSTLEGNEEALSFYDDKLVVDQLRHAVRTKGKMTEQRVPYALREESKEGLVDWYADRMDTAFFNHICGNTAQTDVRYTGMNAVTAPSTNRILIAGGQANDESLTSTDTFTLEMVDVARARAENFSIADNTGSLIRPIKHKGGDYYVMFLHDYQVHNLRTNTATGQWQDIQKAAMQGGDVKGNPIFNGALGIHNGVVLHKASRITQGVDSSTGAAVANTRRAVLCGAQSAVIAFGNGGTGVKGYKWNEEMFDYGNQLGVSAGNIFGVKKTKFVPEDDSSTNAEDFGALVISTYAAQPTLS